MAGLARLVEPEWLDELPADDPRTQGSRRDLARINAVMFQAAIMARALARSCGAPKRIVDLGSGDGRFMLGVAESGVYPATLVLISNWFPRAERARANAYFNLCMPLAVAGSAPVTSWLLKSWNGTSFAGSTGWANWQATLIIEGALPFFWLPIWLWFISDRPRDAEWISTEERQFLETTLDREAGAGQAGKPAPVLDIFKQPTVFLMMVIYFLQNCAAYGCNTFLTSSFDGAPIKFTEVERGLLFAVPYIVTAFVMVINSKHSEFAWEPRNRQKTFVGCVNVSDSFRLKNWNMFRSCGDAEF